MSKTSKQTRALVIATAVAAPAALAVETTARLLLLPPEFSELRLMLRPKLTVMAWALVGVSALSIAAGLLVHQRLFNRMLARTPEAERNTRHIAEAHGAAFLLSASVPQLPTLLSTLTFTFGASLLPVSLSLAVSSIGVGVLGIKAWRGH